MEKEAINAALVEACPKIFVRPVGASGWNYRNSNTGRVMPCINGSPSDDLNAMHEALAGLTDAEWQQCIWSLTHHLFGSAHMDHHTMSCGQLHALLVCEPGVIAKAFLYAKGLRVDAPEPA